MRRRTARKRGISALAVLALAMSIAPFARLSSRSASRPANLPAQHLPDAVTKGSAVPLGPVDPHRHLHLFINLPLRNSGQLNSLLQRLYSGDSPAYHRFLSVAEFTDRFGPTPQDYAAVIAWARANGLGVTAESANRLMVSVDASADAINRAFHVRMTRYRQPAEPNLFYAPDRQPTVSGLKAALLQVAGMSDYWLPQTMQSTSTAATATFTHSGSGAAGDLLPGDVRAAYYGAGPLTGKGQTIGVVELTGYRTSDWQSYLSETGTSTTVPVTKVLVGDASDPCDTEDSCDDGEPITDIVFAIGMAPGLSELRAYVYPSNEVPILAQIATEDICNVISVSWGFGAGNAASDEQYFLEFAAQGQSLVHASGDKGSGSPNTFFDVHPLVTQVGGTVLATSGPGGTRISETAWPGSGGGYLNGTALPSYQQSASVISASNGGSTTLRNSPDVSLVAANLVGWSHGDLSPHGVGTSFSAPAFAGFLALVNEQSLQNGHGPVGAVNPALYNAGVDHPDAFHDVTSGSNGRYTAVVGYDLVTGWGTPASSALIYQLAVPPGDPVPVER